MNCKKWIFLPQPRDRHRLDSSQLLLSANRVLHTSLCSQLGLYMAYNLTPSTLKLGGGEAYGRSSN